MVGWIFWELWPLDRFKFEIKDFGKNSNLIIYNWYIAVVSVTAYSFP